MKKILNPIEFAETFENSTIESYIRYLQTEKTETEKQNDNQKISKTLNTINNMMKTIEFNLAIIIIEKLNNLNYPFNFNQNDTVLLDEIKSLLKILQSTEMKNIPPEFSLMLASRIEQIDKLCRDINQTNKQIVTKQNDYSYLSQYANSHELLRKISTTIDNTLINFSGSLVNMVKPYAEAETRRITQIESMIYYINELEKIQAEYYQTKATTKPGILKKSKRKYNETLDSIKQKYEQTLQEAIDYFKQHPGILCVVPTPVKNRVKNLTIENLDDLKKAPECQIISTPNPENFIEVQDIFKQEEIIIALNTVRQLYTLLFIFNKNNDGFYQFAINEEQRKQLLSAQVFLNSFYQKILERRKIEEDIAKNTKLTDQEQIIYNRISAILGYVPSTKESIHKTLRKIATELTELNNKNNKNYTTISNLCHSKIAYPPTLKETIYFYDVIKSLYYSNNPKEKTSKKI